MILCVQGNKEVIMEVLTLVIIVVLFVVAAFFARITYDLLRLDAGSFKEVQSVAGSMKNVVFGAVGTEVNGFRDHRTAKGAEEGDNGYIVCGRVSRDFIRSLGS